MKLIKSNVSTMYDSKFLVKIASLEERNILTLEPLTTES